MTVIRLGALCELESETQRQRNFRISEFAVLDDGTEITLHAERGFGSLLHDPEAADAWARETSESLEASVLTVVLPDDAEETGEQHPWSWLLELLAARGIQTTVEGLKTLPYEVRFGDSVRARLEHRG